MILDMYMNREGINGQRIYYWYTDAVTGAEVATALNTASSEVQLDYAGKQYDFPNMPHRVLTAPLNIKYPYGPKGKKAFGFYIMQGENRVAVEYDGSITVGKYGIFPKSMMYTAFLHGGRAYVQYHVGLLGDTSHYYCLLDEQQRTVAIVARHTAHEKGCHATVYVDSDSDVLLALLACTATIVNVANVGSREAVIDPTAGLYVSLYSEEKAMYDPTFIPRIKQRDGVTD